jgi:hypothetical protein
MPALLMQNSAFLRISFHLLQYNFHYLEPRDPTQRYSYLENKDVQEYHLTCLRTIISRSSETETPLEAPLRPRAAIAIWQNTL